MPRRKERTPPSSEDSDFEEDELESLPGPSSRQNGSSNRSSGTPASSFPASPRPRKPQDGPSVTALPRPSYTTATLGDLHNLVTQGLINLDVSYQRGVVWPQKKMEQLIDSLFSNVYIPPLLFSAAMDDDGSEVRRCMDGKQRLSSIVAFMEGEIPYRDPVTHRRWWYKQNPENTRPNKDILSDYHKQLYRIKSIPIVEYNHIKDAQERDIFARVQLGMALTAAEKMAASSGPWPDFIHSILPNYTTHNKKALEEMRLDEDDSSDEEDEDRPSKGSTSLNGRVIDLKRGKAYQIFSQSIMVLLDEDASTPAQLSAAAVQSRLLDRPEKPSPQLSRELTRIFDRFFHLTLIPPTNYDPARGPAPKKKGPKPKQAKENYHPTHEVFNKPAMLAPIEFVYVMLLVRMFWELNDERMLETIYEFRLALRAKFPNEVKQNSSVVKFVCTWLFSYQPTTGPPKFPLADPKEYAPLVDVWHERPGPMKGTATPRRRTTTKKKKGDHASDDDEDRDYKPVGGRKRVRKE